MGVKGLVRLKLSCAVQFLYFCWFFSIEDYVEHFLKLFVSISPYRYGWESHGNGKVRTIFVCLFFVQFLCLSGSF